MTDSARARRATSDVSTCPVGHRCEACGTALSDMFVTTVDSPVGVLCLTLCQSCRPQADLALSCIGVGTAERFAAQHAMHLAMHLAVLRSSCGIDPASGAMRRAVVPDVPWP